MRPKADNFEVENPTEAMGKFKSLLGKLVRVPKGELKRKRKKPKSAKRSPAA